MFGHGAWREIGVQARRKSAQAPNGCGEELAEPELPEQSGRQLSAGN